MLAGDRARKGSLIEYGFRLPSALDNRPLSFEEMYRKINQVVFVSATPGEFELSRSGRPVEQLIRPTACLTRRLMSVRWRDRLTIFFPKSTPAPPAGMACSDHHPDQENGGGSHDIF